jgi:hypothetical protein
MQTLSCFLGRAPPQQPGGLHSAGNQIKFLGSVWNDLLSGREGATRAPPFRHENMRGD